MGLYVFGLNHNSADLVLREKLAVTAENRVSALTSLISDPDIDEAVILSTCNRCELYCISPSNVAPLAWLQHYHLISLAELSPHLYIFEGNAALKHLFRVAGGLDSMVLGESEIFGQVKDAFQTAVEVGAVGSQFHGLFQHVFTVTKQIRNQTGIGEQPVSIAYTAVNLAKCIFANLSALRILLVGAGQTVQLAAEHFAKLGVSHMTVANRTLEHAEELAKNFQANAITLDKIPDYLPNVDVVLTATGSEVPLLTAPTVSTALSANRRQPLFMVDLAVPRDIDPAVGTLDGVYLYNIDDLKKMTDAGLAKREAAAKIAEKMIQAEVTAYLHRLNDLDFAAAVRVYRDQVGRIREIELEKALHQLKNGEDPETVLRSMARTLTNKLMHAPSVQLRQAGSQGQQEFLEVAKRLLGITSVN
jgi:glutamyl-tRNA reductase